MFMYAHVCVCVCVCVRACVRACVCVCMCMHVQMNQYIQQIHCLGVELDVDTSLKSEGL